MISGFYVLILHTYRHVASPSGWGENLTLRIMSFIHVVMFGWSGGTTCVLTRGIILCINNKALEIVNFEIILYNLYHTKCNIVIL